MLSFHPDEKHNSFPIAHGYKTKDCVGKPHFTVYFVHDYSQDRPSEIVSSDTKTLLKGDRYRLMSEFALSKAEFEILVDRVSKGEPVVETSSRTLKVSDSQCNRNMQFWPHEISVNQNMLQIDKLSRYNQCKQACIFLFKLYPKCPNR